MAGRSDYPTTLKLDRNAIQSICGAIATPVLVVVMMAGLWKVLDAREIRRQEIARAKLPAPAKLDATAYVRGRQLYGMACVACHGPEGKGVPGLGKDLVQSPFAKNRSDAQLAAFIIAGRAGDDPSNASKIPMPPRGGRMDFSDGNIADVVTYLRGLADPPRAPASPLPEIEVVVGEPEPAEPTVATAAPGDAAPGDAALGAASAKPAAPASAAPASAAPASAAPASAAPVAAAAVTFDPQAAARGKKAFVSCIACHGKDGRGIPKMGKSLVDNPFVSARDDKALVEFIKKGRGPTDPENTTRVGMPPKGGNPALKDPQIHDIVAYIRSLNGGVPTASAAAPASVASVASAVSATPAPIASAQPPASAQAAPAAAPAPVASATPSVRPTAAPGDAIARGKKAYVSCIACHGKDANGVKNMGKSLIDSAFVAKLSDDALVEFIKKGRGPTDPENTTKVGMPPKGGNPALKDEQIRDIVTYIRSLRQSAASAQ